MRGQRHCCWRKPTIRGMPFCRRTAFWDISAFGWRLVICLRVQTAASIISSRPPALVMTRRRAYIKQMKYHCKSSQTTNQTMHTHAHTHTHTHTLTHSHTHTLTHSHKHTHTHLHSMQLADNGLVLGVVAC